MEETTYKNAQENAGPAPDQEWGGDCDKQVTNEVIS